MRLHLLPVVAAGVLSACSDGVSFNDTPANDSGLASPSGNGIVINGSVSAEGADTSTAAALAINDPLNTALEPDASPWVGASRQRLAECSSGASQSVTEAFSTQAFSAMEDENGPYLLSNRSTGEDSQYIEFCLSVAEFARYRIKTRVQANDISEDSFFVTIDEDAPGSVAEPGIYDISRSAVFKDDYVRTRTENPLSVTLTEGEHVFRFYLREPNVALRSITLEINDTGGPVVPPGSDAIAQCAANTGLSVAEVDSLITQHLGNVERKFVLTPFEEVRSYTTRNDYKWDTSEGRGNIMCLAPPPAGGSNLVDNTITEGRLVIGSEGVDEHRFNTPVVGTFIGNGGNDSVGAIDGGLFVGGDGDDSVRLIRAGTFDGGAGDDAVGVVRDGDYLGGSGNDTLTTQLGGVFDGGEGSDSIERQVAASESFSIEQSGELFELLPAPTNLEFADSTATSTLARWSASADSRVDGYIVTNTSIHDVDQLQLDLGISPLSIAGPQTASTQLLVSNIFDEDTLIQVRAYTQLGEESFLYSSPVEKVFVAPDGPNGGSLIASVEVPVGDLEFEATLADTGSVITWNFRSPSLFNTPALYRFNSQLQNRSSVFNDSLTDTGFRVFAGDSRQYAFIRGEDDEPASVVAFNGDASDVIWEQTLPAPTSFVFNFANGSYVTQDDWFVSVRDTGESIAVYEPDGNQYIIDTSAFPFYRFNTLTDGDNAVVVHFPDVRLSNNTPDTQYPFYTVTDVLSGEQRGFTLDNVEELADTQVTAQALAVDGNHFLLAGTFVNNCTLNGTCTDASGLEEGSFLARVQLNDGQVQAAVTAQLSERAGDGIGKLVGRSVYFGRGDAYSRYNADTLALEARALVPGIVQDFSDDAVLSLEVITNDDRIVESLVYNLSRPE